MLYSIMNTSFFHDFLMEARNRLSGRPLTIQQFGVGAAAARLKDVLLGPSS